VTLHVAPGLRPLLVLRHRSGVVPVPVDGSATLGHLVQSLGLPLTEVGELHVDGEPVPPSYRPQHGEIVDVHEVSRPQQAPTWPPRFILDVHLGTLARRLRLLGVDTQYRNDANDDELIADAAADQRVLLTQDRGLLRRKAAQHAAFVRGARPDDQLQDFLDRFRPPLAPRTRCVACNGPLAPVAKAEVAERLQPGTRRSYDEFVRCRSCGHVYWHGAHARRIDTIVTTAVSGLRWPPARTSHRSLAKQRFWGDQR
jgi:uncharacterized protein with PIN domain